MPRKRLSVRARLEAYRTIDPVTSCWLWTKSCGKKGYGQIWIVDTFVRVPRAAYEVFIGPIPEGLFVLHRCDNPPCFNPDHLFAGTQSENIRDCVAKGRWSSKPHSVCDKGHPKPYRGVCRICNKEYRREFYIKNRERLLAKARLRDRRNVITCAAK